MPLGLTIPQKPETRIVSLVSRVYQVFKMTINPHSPWLLLPEYIGPQF